MDEAVCSANREKIENNSSLQNKTLFLARRSAGIIN